MLLFCHVAFYYCIIKCIIPSSVFVFFFSWLYCVFMCINLVDPTLGILPNVSVIPGVRVCALGLHRGSQHHAVHGHIHLPQGLDLHRASTVLKRPLQVYLHFIKGYSDHITLKSLCYFLYSYTPPFLGLHWNPRHLWSPWTLTGKEWVLLLFLHSSYYFFS